ncbi:hypothetical protein GCM10010912_57700 [Paenibacillus albidus]|uniref:Uncharacterized protein n=1 Tax=Paenibacillus albidus TaxID=2041023 RepID=A0A917D2D4_9BACL|nr:hypothetical protein [Paenibacillus albidus]GGG05466.1 hypothetical protein GCM10010912_57700 [Paenibacillus albidus]
MNHIAIKNWPAVRFWTQSGFNGISGIYGDKTIAEDSYANIELIKSLL